MRCFISPTIFRFPEVDRIHRELKKKPFKKTLQYIWNKQHKDFYVNEFFKVLFSHQWTYFHNFAQLLCENLYFKFMACAMIFGIKSDSFQAFLFASLNIVACKIYWCPLFFHCQVGMITNSEFSEFTPKHSDVSHLPLLASTHFSSDKKNHITYCTKW